MKKTISFLLQCQLIVLSCIPSNDIFSQIILQGQVLDIISSQAIEGVNVFIANTQVGTTTDKEGNFVLENVPVGVSYRLIFSHIAYKNFQVLLDRNNIRIKLQINLESKAIDLETVNVIGLQEKKRKQYFRRFKKEFLGTGRNASKTEIRNPEVLDFEINEVGELEVSANDLIQIENRAIGYKLYFLLENFQTLGEEVTYSGKPFFEALNPDNERIAKQWAKNRETTFNGSLRHFLQSLMRNQWQEEGFEIFHASLVNQQNFVAKAPARTRQILERGDTFNENYLTINDFLKVVYTREELEMGLNEGGVGRMGNQLGQNAEREMIQQGQQDAGRSRNFQTSYLFSRKPHVRLDTVGMIAEAGMVKEYGYWVNERVADLLPLEYVPRMAFQAKKEGTSNAKKDKINTPTLLGFELKDLRIPLKEIMKGGPPKDGIPAIDYPKYVSAEEVDFLLPSDQVLGLEINGLAKAFPLRILDHHEIVNEADFVVSYCPLCNSGNAFQTLVDGQSSTFGVSGLLYNSDVLMYDRNTESLWSQIKGEAVAGYASGEKLQLLPVVHTTWADWKAQHPNTLVLSTETGYKRDYSKTAYDAYRASNKLMFPVGEVNHKMGKKTLVLGVEIGGQFKAYPFPKLKQKAKDGMVEDSFNGKVIQIHYNSEQNTAYATDSEGDLLGSGMTLYWFAWFAFHPETEVF